MYLKEIWRYPVKSMAGERLEAAELREKGIAGDRLVQARAPSGRIVTARSRPGLLGHRATMGSSGEPLVDGQLWSSAEIALRVREAAGPGVELSRSDREDRFDILPLLVGSDGAFAALGFDHRRFRPNLVIGGVDGLAERGWEGRRLAVGDAVIQLADLRGRCVMVTYDPDTLAQDLNVLRRVARDYDGVFCLNCAIEKGAPIRVGDPVRLLDTAER